MQDAQAVVVPFLAERFTSRDRHAGRPATAAIDAKIIELRSTQPKVGRVRHEPERLGQFELYRMDTLKAGTRVRSADGATTMRVLEERPVSEKGVYVVYPETVWEEFDRLDSELKMVMNRLNKFKRASHLPPEKEFLMTWNQISAFLDRHERDEFRAWLRRREKIQRDMDNLKIGGLSIVGKDLFSDKFQLDLGDGRYLGGNKILLHDPEAKKAKAGRRFGHEVVEVLMGARSAQGAVGRAL